MALRSREICVQDSASRSRHEPVSAGRRRPRTTPAPRSRMDGERQASLLEGVLVFGRLYADQRGNAVVLLIAGGAQRPVEAELRGTRRF